MSDRASYELAIDTLRGVFERTGSPAAKWAADYLDADPDRRAGVPVPSEPRREVELCHDCGMGYSCAKHDPAPAGTPEVTRP